MPKLLYLVTEDWYFCSHRLPMARAARDAGFEVVVATRCKNHRSVIEAEGFRAIPIIMRRESRNPWHELAAILELVRLYRRERPDLVHHVALKPTLYGSVAATLARRPAVVNAMAGMGFAFIGDGVFARSVRWAALASFRLLLNRRGYRLIIQNDDDLRFLLGRRVIRADRVALIRGSGVDVENLRPSPFPQGPPVALLVGRMLLDKGIGEAVAAARILRDRKIGVRVVLVGEPDPSNPRSIPAETLRAWVAEGVVDWWGYQSDIASVWAKAHIAILPSYREGMPKSLLEAAACGRPLVATDVPGCRELVRHEENGLLIPPRDATALADAIERLAQSPDLRERLGRRARAVVETDYAEPIIAAQTTRLYFDVLRETGTLAASA